MRRVSQLLFAVVMMCSAVFANARNIELFEPGPVAVPAGKAFTLKDVRKAVLSGAMFHHWQMESETPGKIRIKLDGRRDRAVLVMEVVYDTKSYSIKYVSSENLKYDGHSIHPSYARWMKNLTDAIDMQLKIMEL